MKMEPGPLGFTTIHPIHQGPEAPETTIVFICEKYERGQSAHIHCDGKNFLRFNIKFYAD